MGHYSWTDGKIEYLIFIRNTWSIIILSESESIPLFPKYIRYTNNAINCDSPSLTLDSNLLTKLSRLIRIHSILDTKICSNSFRTLSHSRNWTNLRIFEIKFAYFYASINFYSYFLFNKLQYKNGQDFLDTQ